MNTIQQSKGAFSKKFLTALAISFFFSTAGSMDTMAGVSAAKASLGVSEQQQQTISIKGTVTDSNGEAVIGASIFEKGSPKNGTVTDIDGLFTLKVKPNATLIVSYIGFKKQEVAVDGKAAVSIVLKENSELLDEVVVVGYGTQKKVNLTGAVSNINVKEAIAGRPITDVAKALQGISPGLTITNKIGGVGAESTIKLRGSVGSLSATGGTSPLILVDNVEVPSLNLVNPDDIETISVLKDAASASIYGTRAAWGVILITTKTGKLNDKVKITYSNNFAWNAPTKMVKQSSAYDNAVYMMLSAGREGNTSVTSIGYNVDQEAVNKMKEWKDQYGDMSQSDLGEMQLGRDFEIRGGKTYFYRSFNPVEEFTKDWTPQQNHNLSVSGGSDKTTFNISLGYLNQSGVMKFNTDEYDRYNFNSNITTKIRDWWKVRANVLFTRSNNSQPYKYTSGQYDAWYYLLRWPAFYPYASYQGKDFRSAVTDIKQANRENYTSNFTRVNLGTELNPIKDLSINFDYTFAILVDNQKRNGGQVWAYNMFAANPTTAYSNIYGDSENRVVQQSKYTMSNIFKAYATYNKSINSKHNFKTMVGFDAETREKLGHYSERRTLVNLNQPEIALAIGNQYSDVAGTDDAYHNDFAAAGFFGRLNYDYQQKYLLEVNARYDGSSKFPTGKKWAFFPSASVGWRASEESFMNWAKPALSNLKLRGSWGTIGNQDVASNSFLSTMSVGASSGWVQGDAMLPYISSPTVISPSLTWERVTTMDLGIESRFFNDEFGVTFDWYRRTTTDMHSQGSTLPSTYGATVPKINYGEMQGNGFELALDYNHAFNNGLGVNLRGSFSKIKEKLTKYSNATKTITGYYEGKELGEIWGYETDRLFQKDDFNADGTMKAGIANQSLYESGFFKYGPGDVKYKDLDGDGKISYGSNTVDDHGDLKKIGNSLPNFEYSFTIGLSYKGFDFSTFFQGVGSRDYWGIGNVAIPGFMPTEAAYQHQMDYWTADNTDAFYPRPTSHSWVSNGRNFLTQTRYLLDMSYLRCKNITLGYSLPLALLKKASFQSARIYVSAENLFEFDNLSIPVDPETTEDKYGNTQGYSFGRSYPYSRTISFGVQVGF